MVDVTVLAQVASDYFRTQEALPVPQGVVVDAGANVGMYTTLVALAQPTVVVHAFEPLAKAFASAGRNVAANGVADRVHLHRAALGREETSLPLALAYRGSQGTLAEDVLCDVRTGKTEQVPVVPLDTYCQRHGVEHIDILKIDVEGWEVEVLRGAQRILPRTRVVVLEWHSLDRAEYAHRLLEDAGLAHLVPVSDDPSRQAGIGYWVRPS
jgi:FkbM family methyltransferase